MSDQARMMLNALPDASERGPAQERANEYSQRGDIEELRARLALVFENNGDGVWDWYAADNMIHHTFHDRMSGSTVTEVLTLDRFLEDVHPNDRQGVLDTAMAHFDGRTAFWDHEYRMIDEGSGEYVWVQSRGSVISRNAADIPQRFVGSTTNIDRRKRAEEAKRTYERERDRIVAVMDSSSDIIGIVDLGGRTLYANPACGRLLGYEDNTAPTISNVHTAEGAELLRGEALHSALHNGSWQGENTIVHRNGTRIPVVQSVFPVRSSAGELLGYGTIIKDITAQKKLETELRESNERLNAVKERLRITLQSIGDAVVATDRDGCITMMNSVAEALCGCAFEQAMGRDLSEVLCLHDPLYFSATVNPVSLAVGAQEDMPRDRLLQLQRRDGSMRVVACTASPIRSADGWIEGAVTVFRDVTEATRKEEEIHYLSYHDALTGLYNRAYFEEQACRMDADTPQVSVIMGDVNGLKLTNDVFGHAEGDHLLREIADILRECCRAQDSIARWGGDEYAVLLPGASAQVVQDICHAIYQSCQDHAQNNSGGSCTSISLGFATRTDAGEPIASLLKTAEDAMYKRKLLESRSLHSSIIASIRTTLLEKSHETEKHAARLIHLTRAMGQALGLSSDRLDDLELFSILHDMGKIGISDQILNKAGPLNAQDWQEIRKHPEIGFRIAQASPEIVHIAEYILSHHEHWDGNGYPQGLSGRAIPQAARILAIADAYDAMTSDRVYRKALPADRAIAEIRRCAGMQFDPELVDVFLSERMRAALQME